MSLKKISILEASAGDEGLEITWGIVPSPLGEMLVGICNEGVRYLSFPNEERELVIGDEWPDAILVENMRFIASFVERFFGDNDDQINIIVKGTSMQLQVWRALLKIPKGELTTYGEIAASIGKPKAVRAVGTAIGRNPVSYLIPCHRVVRKSGELGGYRWGLEVKKRLIASESA